MDDFLFGIAWSFRPPAVVLVGTSASLQWFAKFLRTITGGGTYRPDAILCTNAVLEMIVTEGPASLNVADNIVAWTLPPRMLTTYALQVEAIASSSEPCHAYLDPEASGNWTLIVSKGEYTRHIFE